MFKEKSGLGEASSLDIENPILSLISQSVKEVTNEKQFDALEGKKDLLYMGDIRKITEDFEDGKISLDGADTAIKEAEDALNKGEKIIVVKNESGVETYIVGRN